MQGTIEIPATISEALEAALLEEDDLRTALRRAAPAQPVAGEAGIVQSRPRLVLRRPLDPEYAEMREIEVTLEPLETGWRVVRVQGLDSIV